MAYVQQITREQEALNYLPAANEYYYDQYSRNDESRFVLEKRNWKTLKQNNSSGKYLTDKELEYVALMNGFLKNARFGVEYFALDFLCSELGVTERHLRRIRTNTSHIFTTKWRKVTRSYKGKLENVYVVRPTEHTVFLLGETNYYKSEYNSFVNDSVKSVKLGHQCPTSYNKDENNINIRSNGANFVECNFNSKNISTELVETSSGIAKGSSFNSSTDTQTPEQAETLHEPQAVETTNPTQTPSTRQREDTPRPSNVVRNGFLGSSKHISEIQPYLTDELCETLRSKSGKLFTNQAIRQITKAIAASKRGQYVEFKHINGVVAYLTPALANEKRDPNKIGSDSYYTLAGMTAEDKLLHEKEKYLNQVENSGIQARCDYTQYRARIAGQFPINLAYDLLTNMVEVKMEENVLKITMHKPVPLGENQVQLLLYHAKGIGGYAGVNELEFVAIASNSNPSLLVGYPQETIQYAVTQPVGHRGEPELPKGKWGKICAEFVAEFGMELYKHWIAPLNVEEDNELILLSSNSGMILDRIMDKYWQRISDYSEAHNINLNIKYSG